MTKKDYSKLLGRMRERGVTQKTLAKAIKVGETTLNLSLNNKREFRQGEIKDICVELEIPSENIADYFFYVETYENVRERPATPT